MSENSPQRRGFGLASTFAASTTALWAWALTVIFVIMGGGKLLFAESAIARFAGWGLPDWLRVLTAVVELGGAVLVAIPATRFIGASVLAVITLVAVLTHLAIADLISAVLPVLLLVLSAALAWRILKER